MFDHEVIQRVTQLEEELKMQVTYSEWKPASVPGSALGGFDGPYALPFGISVPSVDHVLAVVLEADETPYDEEDFPSTEGKFDASLGWSLDLLLDRSDT